MKDAILTVFCAATAALWGGCNRPTPTHVVDSTHAVDSTLGVDSTLTAEQLLANPQGHARVVVKVRGCLYRGFEVLVLFPCDSLNRTQSIWLDNAKIEKELTRLNRLHPKYWPRPGTELFFQFDEARNSRAWKRLDASFNFDEVVLVGQFETGSGFGHLNAYMHELILVDVLATNPTRHHNFFRDQCSFNIQLPISRGSSMDRRNTCLVAGGNNARPKQQEDAFLSSANSRRKKTEQQALSLTGTPAI